VRRALDAKSRGDDVAYQQICDMLKNGGGGPMQRQLPLISSLAKCTAMLNARVHHSVVSIVLNNCWRSRPLDSLRPFRPLPCPCLHTRLPGST